MSAADRDKLAFVVVGGYEYEPAMNHSATLTVRELARRYRVLNINSEAHGSILPRLRGRAMNLDGAGVARTVFGSTRPRRVEERVWVAPVRGLAAIGPLSTPEPMRRRNVRMLTRVITGWMAEQDVERCALLFYWWSLPELVQTVPNLVSIYDCIDEMTVLPGALIPARVVDRLEGKLLDAVDRTYVVSSGLLARRAAPGRHVEVLASGIDLRLFASVQRDGFPVPDSVRELKRPVIGYVGGLTSRMDWELLEELAARRPDWNFALVGGDPGVAPRTLHGRPNVLFQPSVPYPEALGAVSRFDVGIIPVRPSAFSRGNSFMKLLDYFAHGIPVVAPPLPDSSQVEADRPGLLALAGDPDGWEAALAAALAEPADSPMRQARRQYVQQRSVERRIEQILDESLNGRL